MNLPPGPPPLPERVTIERTVAAGIVWEFPAKPSGFLAKILDAAPGPFWGKDFGIIAAAAAKLHASGVPVAVLTLQPVVGRPDILGSLARDVCGPGITEHCAQLLWEAYVQEDLYEQITDTLTLLQSGPQNLPALATRLEAFGPAIRSALSITPQVP